MVLLIDNYDSFTWNLVQLFYGLGAEVRVVRNDEVSLEWIASSPHEHLVISPGPCSPSEAGVSVEAIRRSSVPVLGVCLGHQAIGAAFGATVAHAPSPVHGYEARIAHDGTGIFHGIEPEFRAARYHSLAVSTEALPEALEATAFARDDGTAAPIVMALRHRARPIVGVQFHPESVLTPRGPALVKNFLEGRR